MDFLKNIISMLTNSNIDLTRILSMLSQNNATPQNSESNLSNIIDLLSKFMPNTQSQSTPTNYTPLDYNEVYQSNLDK